MATSFPSSPITSLKDKRTSLGMQFMGDQKKRELRDLFNSFDIDKDGKISHSEFKQVLAASGVDPQSVMTIVCFTHHSHFTIVYNELLFSTETSLSMSSNSKITIEQKILTC